MKRKSVFSDQNTGKSWAKRGRKGAKSRAICRADIADFGSQANHEPIQPLCEPAGPANAQEHEVTVLSTVLYRRLFLGTPQTRQRAITMLVCATEVQLETR